MFYGWWMVIASFFLFVYAGGTHGYGFTAFFDPILKEFGWTRAEMSLGFSLRSMEMGIIDPVIGLAIDRFGPRRAILLGAIIAGAAVVLMSRVGSLVEFYATLGLLALGAALAFGLPQYTAIANWFARRRSFTMGVLSVGYGVSGALVPILAVLIQSLGWRTTLVMVGIGLWILGIPLSFVFRHRPQDYGLLPDGDVPVTAPSRSRTVSSEAGDPRGSEVRAEVIMGGPELSVGEALRTSAFWLLIVFSSFMGLSHSAMGIHEMPYLVTIGIPVEMAALTMTGITLSSIIGRLGFSWLGDRYDKRYLLAIAAGLQNIGIVIFGVIQEPWHILLFLLTYGPGYAGPIPLTPALQADYFGAKTFATLRGIQALGWVFTGFVGPLFAGWVCDVTGSYRLAWLVFAFVGSVGIPVAFLIKPPLQNAREAVG